MNIGLQLGRGNDRGALEGWQGLKCDPSPRPSIKIEWARAGGHDLFHKASDRRRGGTIEGVSMDCL